MEVALVVYIILGIILLLGIFAFFISWLGWKYFTDRSVWGDQDDYVRPRGGTGGSKVTGRYARGSGIATVVLYEKDEGQSKQMHYETRKLKKETEVRKLQDSLIHLKITDEYHQKESASLIIGVDATPHNIGGYFINLENKTGQFYSFGVESLPWILNTPATKADRKGNSAEFETKNIFFALLLWEEEIKHFRQKNPNGNSANFDPSKNKSKTRAKTTVLLCTDNFEIINKKTEYGRRVSEYLNHLQNCEQIPIQLQVYSTDPQRIENHAKYVKVADDFSRKNFRSAKDFLFNYFGIKRGDLKGTHRFNFNKRKHEVCSTITKEYLERVKRNQIVYKSSHCPKCHFIIQRTESLQSIRID